MDTLPEFTTARRWISVPYSPKRVAVGISGGESHFFITHQYATPEQLREDGRVVAEALNNSVVGRTLLNELAAKRAPVEPGVPA